jgi:hypothetical protein
MSNLIGQCVQDPSPMQPWLGSVSQFALGHDVMQLVLACPSILHVCSFKRFAVTIVSPELAGLCAMHMTVVKTSCHGQAQQVYCFVGFD